LIGHVQAIPNAIGSRTGPIFPLKDRLKDLILTLFLTLSFDMQKQTWLDALHFDGGSMLKEIPCGKGRIFWAGASTRALVLLFSVELCLA
jgi:hypothetical protein